MNFRAINEEMGIYNLSKLEEMVEKDREENLKNLCAKTIIELQNISLGQKKINEDDINNQVYQTGDIEKMRNLLRGPLSATEEEGMLPSSVNTIDEPLNGTEESLKNCVYQALEAVPSILPPDIDKEKAIPEMLDLMINDLTEIINTPWEFKNEHPTRMKQLIEFFSKLYDKAAQVEENS